MSKHTIHVLASDFEGNDYMNVQKGKKGCPLTRALTREFEGDEIPLYNKIPPEQDKKVCKMFDGDIPIEDFSFEIEV